jgi:hypothetical protein
VLLWRDGVRPPLVELHIVGVGVTQYDEVSQDPTDIVLDYVRLQSGACGFDAQVEYHDPMVTRTRRGWRGYVVGHRVDTYTVEPTREALCDSLKRLLGEAIAREESGRG